MSFPAREQFFAERRDPVTRVYLYCLKRLHLKEVREIKRIEISHVLKMHPANAKRALDELVADGFLDEHPRENPNDPRRFTLAFETGRPVRLVLTPAKSA